MSREDPVRTVLEELAAGRIQPEEAAVRLDELGARHRAAAGGDRDDEPIARIRVTGLFQPTRIRGRAEVRAATVSGAHRLRRDGDQLIVEGGERGPTPAAATFAFEPLAFGWRNGEPIRFRRGGRPAALDVAMNPELPLAVDLTAGTLLVEGVHAPISVDVAAGSARLDGVRAPVRLQVASGTVTVGGVLDRGLSRIRCEAGMVTVHLERGSSVRILARTALGQVSLPGGEGRAGWSMGGRTEEATVGDGAGTLEIETSMGSVRVTAAD